MKNLLKHSLLYLSISALIFTFSCGDDEEELTPNAPSVTVTVKVNGVAATSPATVKVGDVISLDLVINAPGNFNTFRAETIVESVTTPLGELTRNDVDGVTDFTTEFSVTGLEIGSIEESLAGKSFTYSFEAVDDLDQTGTATFEVDMVEVSSPAARVYSAVLLAVPTGDLTNENFFSSSDGMVYSSDEVTSTAEAVSPKIDFGYYYGNTDLASIASPAAFESTVFAAQVDGWNTLNETVIKSTSLTASQFNEVVSFADIDEVFDGGTDEAGIISGLAEGDVVAFETAAGLRGLILITEIQPGFDSNDFINIDVIVQEAE